MATRSLTVVPGQHSCRALRGADLALASGDSCVQSESDGFAPHNRATRGTLGLPAGDVGPPCS